MSVIIAPAPAAGRSVRLGGRRYPVLLPRITDPRLHVAATIITVQVLGQTVLDFDVSIAQILITIATAAVLELVIVAATAQVIAWPASALLTGNGVALLLRTPGTEHGDWWSTRGWPIFMAAAGISLLSKYAIRVGGRHIFNPSNFGLVVIFLVFGPRWADPQDLWWGPWRPALALTLAVILVGGITLSIRLDLFSVAATFWLTFAASIAVLAATGHAITARWHVGLLEGWEYWLVYVLSPEIVIFVFFMITDPKTAPTGRVARVVYASSIGFTAGILAGFQRTEFATKVSLLVALVFVCAATPWIEKRFAETSFTPRGVRAGVAFGALALLAVLGAGWIGEEPSKPAVAEITARAAGARPEVRLPAGTVPEVTLDAALADVAGAVSDAEAQKIGRDVIEDLVIVSDAAATGDADLAAHAAFGPFLRDIQAEIAAGPDGGVAPASDGTAVPDVTALEVVLLQDPVSPQAIPQLGLVVTRAGDDGLEQQLYLVTELDGAYRIGQELPPSSPMRVR